MLQIGRIDGGELTDIIEESHKSYTNQIAEDNAYYVNGWYKYTNKNGEICHPGNNPSYSSYIVIRPEEGVGVAVLCNQNTDYAMEIGDNIKSSILGDAQYTISDTNRLIDQIAIIMTVVMLIVCCICLLFMIRKIRKFINEKKEKINFIRKIVIILTSCMGVLLTFLLQMVPSILSKGIKWSTIYVWYPESIRYVHYLLMITLWLIVINICLSTIIKRKKIKGRGNSIETKSEN